MLPSTETLWAVARTIGLIVTIGASMVIYGIIQDTRMRPPRGLPPDRRRRR